MKNLTKTTLATLTIVALSGCSAMHKPTANDPNAEAHDGAKAMAADQHPHLHEQEKASPAKWSYAGQTGPAYWGYLSPDYILAKDGTQQSPINITSALIEPLPPLETDYKPSTIDLVYNGHTVEETEEQGSTLTIGDREYELKQFHFHAPSEHTIDGVHAAMEMHLVHTDESGEIAVIGVMINEGAENDAFNPVWNYLPTEENKKLKYDATIDTANLLPVDRNYFHYMGSLTTPPCTEGVNWYVLTDPIELSKEQIEKFTAIIDNNNRPTQPLNGRTITVSGG